MYARSTTVLAHRESIDAGVAHIRDEVMPMLLAMDGCVGLSILFGDVGFRCAVERCNRADKSARRGRNCRGVALIDSFYSTTYISLTP